MNNNNIILFDFKEKDLIITDCKINGDTKEVTIEKELVEHICPKCGFKMHSRGIKIRTINHPILQDGYKLILKFKQRRWRCTNLDCAYDISDQVSFVKKNRRTTNALELLVLNSFRSLRNTITDVARTHNISSRLAAEIFDKYVDMKRRPLTHIISVDEVYLDMYKYGKYGLVILDFYSGEPIDLLESRRSNVTEPYFSSIPLKEREKVKYLLSDMYTPYINYVNTYFKNAIPIVDSFHVMKWLLDKIDHMCATMKREFKRRDELNAKNYAVSHHKNPETINVPVSDEVYLLTHHRWVILKNQENIEYDRPSKYNHHFRRIMDTYDYELAFLDLHKDFYKIRELKEQYVTFNKSNFNNLKQVALELDALIEEYYDCNINIFVEFSKTLKKYKQPIVNSFITAIKLVDDKEQESRLSNGPIESINRKIKDIKRDSRGYTNFNRFRNRFLFATRKNPTIKG